MAKKNKKNKKRNAQEASDKSIIEKNNENHESDVATNNDEDIPADKKPESITKRLLKIKSTNVFEDMNPVEHVDELKEQVLSTTAQKVHEIGKQQNTSFPWVEFLIGFSLGAVLLIVMFLFHISFAKNVDERIDSLENKLAMWNPIITSSGHDNFEVITRQKMFESELNNLKHKLQDLKAKTTVVDSGIIVWDKSEEIEVKFTKSFQQPPAVITQVYPQGVLFSITTNNASFTLKIQNNNPDEQYTFHWLAVGNRP